MCRGMKWLMGWRSKACAAARCSQGLKARIVEFRVLSRVAGGGFESREQEVVGRTRIVAQE